jgi:hypothetical protein
MSSMLTPRRHLVVLVQALRTNDLERSTLDWSPMTRTEQAKQLIGGVCGAVGAVAIAVGLVLIVMWTFDTAGVGASLSEMIGGSLALALGALCVVARRRLVSGRFAPSSDVESGEG